MRAVILGLTMLLIPLAGALPADVNGNDVCAPVGAKLCGDAMTAGAESVLFYTQQQLSCDGSTCYYRPTAHLALSVTAPGTWIIRGTTYATNYPSNTLISGSARQLTCGVEGPTDACEAAALGRDVVGNPFNSAKWHGEWRVYLVDPLGEEHLQASYSRTGWLAQYCNCES